MTGLVNTVFIQMLRTIYCQAVNLVEMAANGFQGGCVEDTEMKVCLIQKQGFSLSAK
jgi:hypothetical protein